MIPPPDDRRPAFDEGRSRERLRSQAEARVASALDESQPVDPAELRALVHELSVHQVELELQNEELRRTQTALELARSGYQDLYDDAPIAYLTISATGQLLGCNRLCAETLRIDRLSIKAKTIYDFLSPGSKTLFTERRDQVVATGEDQRFDLELKRAGGPPFWAAVQMRMAREELADSVVFRLAITDVTERKRMEVAAARLGAIVTSADAAILTLDLTGIVTSWNPGAERLFGYRTEEIVGSLSNTLLPVDRHGEDGESMIRVRRGETVAHETIRVRRDGTPVPVFLIASPIYDEVDRIVGVSLIIRDVSDQAASREHLSVLLAELLRREQELERADRRKDEFIATLAHELRNPLAPIRNAVAILRLAPSLPERAVWAREVIDRQVGQMTELLEDLLDVSRITRQTITIKRDRFPIGTAVTQAIEIAQPLIDQRGHRLDLRIDPEPLEVEGDLTRLTQIFGNLLNNAAKYTDPGGTITLTVERHDGAVEIRVQDTGIGIDQEHLPRIFELFSQVRSALDRSHGGLGIGLYLVKGLVELHGGTIEVASGGLGTGTVFVVTLPLAVGEAPAADTGGRRSEPWLVPPARGRRILIADDNRDEAASLALLLRIQDYQVETAADGEEAVAKAESFKPDILLLDLGMPKLNGYEVSRRIRAKPWGADIVIIAYSGWGRPEDRNRSAEAGVDLHLSKPVAPSRLLEVFQSSLEARLHDADS